MNCDRQGLKTTCYPFSLEVTDKEGVESKGDKGGEGLYRSLSTVKKDEFLTGTQCLTRYRTTVRERNLEPDITTYQCPLKHRLHISEQFIKVLQKIHCNRYDTILARAISK